MANMRTKARNIQSHEVSSAFLSIKSHYRFNNARLRIQEELAYMDVLEEEALFEQQLLAEFLDRDGLAMSDDESVVDDHEFTDFIAEAAPKYEVGDLSEMEWLEKVYQV
ncbi:hypothetical protein B484DRAFT_410127 [Ochromonadaceae sp. CCMP2298]|nr:hypothetical protein B484DRAFT_410127 [Ochromonadaceae sp. CCMP2298]